MENASKALIIVGEVLIAIIILSILVAVIVSFGNYSSDMHKKIADQETYQFNSNFLSYTGRVDITSQEIATIINFAKKENDRNNLSRMNTENNELYIDVLIGSNSFFKSNLYIKNDDDYINSSNFNKCVNNFVKDTNTKYYRCQGDFKRPITIKDGVKEIQTIEGDANDIQYNSLRKVNAIKFHEIVYNTNPQYTYSVTESIVVNPKKD